MTTTDPPLSWQSAFLGLAALAINSMTQPVGKILPKVHSISSSLLRISPIVCAAEALVAVAWVACCMFFHETSLRKAARAWVERNTEPDDDIDWAHADEGQKSLESHPLWRLGVIALALLQGIKILSCTGIPWTQTWTCIYLGSFFVQEFLIRLGYTIEGVLVLEYDDRSRHYPHLATLWNQFLPVVLWIAICVHFVSSSLVLSLNIPFPSILSIDSDPYAIAVIWNFLSLGFIIVWALFCAPLMIIDRRAVALLYYAQYVSWYFLMLCLPGVLISKLRLPQSLPRGSRRALRFIALFLGRVKIGVPSVRRGHKCMAQAPFFTTTVVFFVGVLINYAMRYDSTGTHKPGWADGLG